MITSSELIEAVGRLNHDVLQRWIELGWVRPEQPAGQPRFDQADIARVRLIYELRYELRIEEESMPVVLSLLDQLYGTRRHLSRLVTAIHAEPDDVRRRLIAALDPDVRDGAQ